MKDLNPAVKESLTAQDHIPVATKMVCNWHQDDDDGTWATDCGGIFVIIDGAPSDNEMKFCAYCGKPLVEHPFVELEDEE